MPLSAFLKEPVQPIAQVATPETLTKAAQLLQQANQQLYTSQLQTALESFQQAIVLDRASKDHSGEAAGLLGIAETYTWLGQKQESLDAAKQALAIYREVGDCAREAAAYIG